MCYGWFFLQEGRTRENNIEVSNVELSPYRNIMSGINEREPLFVIKLYDAARCGVGRQLHFNMLAGGC
ncbi:hypothetical protein J6590_013653 [Homalodisca vitripennis]|nr:hypothetical protein J6590_013653 [Homalodisca vitripennis]